MSRRAFVRGAMATGAMIALAGGSLTAFADEGGEGSDGDAPSGDDVPEPDEVDASGAVDGGSLSFYITNPVGIEPFDTQENQGIAVALNLFDTLVTWDWGNQTIAPLAAESWEVNEDATVYAFHLRQDAKFHNGQPVTSADFKYSWERICRADFLPSPSTQGYKVEQILGANEMMNGEATELAHARRDPARPLRRLPARHDRHLERPHPQRHGRPRRRLPELPPRPRGQRPVHDGRPVG